VLLWTNYVDILAVVDNFANEWHILKTKKGKFPFNYSFRTTKCKLGLPIKGSLSENGTNKTAVREVIFDFLQYLQFSLGRGANNNNVGPRNYICSIA
jgi:hypothetical protein